MKKAVLIAASALALAGCAEKFSARVLRFQALPPPSGQSFFVEAGTPALQGGLEFSSYARIVAAELTRQGYRPAPDPAHAELLVRLEYGVDQGREKIVSYGGYGYGGFGYGGFGPYGFGGFGGFGGRRGFIYGFNDPFLYGGYGGFGGFGGNDIRSYTVYTSQLQMRINRADNGERVFEGTARAQSRDDDLPNLVPHLITAMFTGFPGNSGQTVNITIAPEKRKAS